MNDLRILKISDWHTPASDYPVSKLGRAEIARHCSKRGYYRMEGVDGYALCQVTRAISVTNLRIADKTWMVDDPLHWYGMQALAKYSHGRVLVAGLGLGLVTHALAATKGVRDITIIEREPDVIALVGPLIPKGIRIIQGNFFAYDKPGYETVIVDLYVRSENGGHSGSEIFEGWALTKARYPEADVYLWGSRSQDINPAVAADMHEVNEVLDHAARR